MINAWDLVRILPQSSQLKLREGVTVGSCVPVHLQVFAQVEAVRRQMAGDGVFIHQAHGGPHIFLGPAALGAFVDAVLEIIHVDLRKGHRVERAEVPHGGPIIPYGGLPGPVGRQPRLIELEEGHGLPFPLLRAFPEGRQGGHGVLLQGEDGGAGLLMPLFRIIRVRVIAQHHHSLIFAVGQLVDAALAVAPLVTHRRGIFLFMAAETAIGHGGDFLPAFNAYHIIAPVRFIGLLIK